MAFLASLRQSGLILALLIFGLSRAASTLSQEPSRETALSRQLEETSRQRAANRQLMLDAAAVTVEAFTRGATSTADRGSQNWARIAEIARELSAAVRIDDVARAAKLAAEGGRLLFLEGVTKATDIGTAVAAIGKVVVGFAPEVIVAGQAYIHFAQRSLEDARLLRRETNLRRQLETLQGTKKTNGQRASTLLPPRTETDNAATSTEPRDAELQELDDALTLNRFFETRDWTVEDRSNLERIAAKYPDIDREFRAALARETTQRTLISDPRVNAPQIDLNRVPRPCANDADRLRDLLSDQACSREVLTTFANHPTIMDACRSAQEDRKKGIALMTKAVQKCIAEHPKEPR